MGTTGPRYREYQWSRAGAPSPRTALEELVLQALQRPPCVVDFSGGRDSSLVLALAAHVARREGLPLPVPLTKRFPLDPGSVEDHWQELVIDHLRLPDWQVSTLTDELDVVGERAQDFLRKYGMILPGRMYILVPSFEAARGGSRLSGEGGDEILGSRRASFARFALESPRGLSKASLRNAVGINVAPWPIRAAMLWRRYTSTEHLPRWIRPDVARKFIARLVLSEASEPLDWRSSLHWHLRQRRIDVHARNIRAIAADYDVVNVDPLLQPSFVSAWARCGGRWGFKSRTEAMTFLAQDLLPTQILARKVKTVYRTAYFTGTARNFVKTWDGTGLDEEIVDPHAVREEWLSEYPASTSFGLLQAAWLSQQGLPWAPPGR